MSDQLKHIFDVSTCPGKRQFKEYLNGEMSREEVYAFEHHVSSCLLCSEALDGMLEHREEALVGLDNINNEFLKDHLELHPPQIHLNSIAPPTFAADTQSQQKNPVQKSFWKSVSIAAALILFLGMGWYFKSSYPSHSSEMLAATETQADKTNMETNAAKADAANKLMDMPNANSNIQGETAVTEHSSYTSSSPAIINYGDAYSENIAAENKPVANNESTKTPAMTARNTRSVAAGAFADTNVSADNIETVKKLKEQFPETMDQADALFEKGSYTQALSIYLKQIKNAEEHTRQQAQFMAAQCYLQTGNEKQAVKLLDSLVENANGQIKRKSKRLLREINNNARAEEL